jgi:hypothetical protein
MGAIAPVASDVPRLEPLDYRASWDFLADFQTTWRFMAQSYRALALGLF